MILLIMQSIPFSHRRNESNFHRITSILFIDELRAMIDLFGHVKERNERSFVISPLCKKSIDRSIITIQRATERQRWRNEKSEFFRFRFLLRQIPNCPRETTARIWTRWQFRFRWWCWSTNGSRWWLLSQLLCLMSPTANVVFSYSNTENLSFSLSLLCISSRRLSCHRWWTCRRGSYSMNARTRVQRSFAYWS